MNPLKAISLFVLYIISVVINALCVVFIGSAFLYTFAGVVGAVWLLFLREWGILGWAVLGYWLGGLIIGFTLLPGRILIPPVLQIIIALMAKRGWLLFPPASVEEFQIYIDKVIQFFICTQFLMASAVWSGIVFHFLVGMAKSDIIIPTLLVAQVASVQAPTMAIEARGRDALAIIVAGACRMGFFLAVAAILIFKLSFLKSFVVFFIAILFAFQVFWSGWHVFGFDKIWLEHKSGIKLK